MATFLNYIQSFRLRTLPLSVSGIILGSCMAAPPLHIHVFLWAIATTLCLQILTNLSNELGDALLGTDTEQQNRPQYGLQQGAISTKGLRNCIWIFAGLSILCGLALIRTTFGTLFSTVSLIFCILGGLAIVAALKYTLGKKPYGYHGMGDLSVLIFFGWLSVVGSYYLQSLTINRHIFIPATALGLMVVGVLNLNNIRDIKNDMMHHKNTVASRLGNRNAKIYHTLLLTISVILYCFCHFYVILLFLPFIIYHLLYVWKHNDADLDRQMPFLSLLTLLISIACGIVSYYRPIIF